MDEMQLFELLESVKNKQTTVQDALESLHELKREGSGYAFLDRYRQTRTGTPEVIFAENKTTEQLMGIVSQMLKMDSVVLATRVSPEKAEAVCKKLETVTFHREARMLSANEKFIAKGIGRGEVMVISAGTSDVPIAEEARLTLKFLGHTVTKRYDIGVAGIHRLFSCLEELRQATVVVVVAGMEGALPSVVAGLIDTPVIAVPTSVGYGVGAGGIAALLGMLNSCSPGVAVVNIDNGFGAGCMAAAINCNR